MKGYLIVWIILLGFSTYYIYTAIKELQKIRERIDELEDRIIKFHTFYTDLYDFQESIVCDIKGISKMEKKMQEIVTDKKEQN